MKKRKNNLKHSLFVLFISLIVSYGTGFVGSLFTVGETEGDWYQSVRPSITPPNWVFPVVWNILFLLIALSLWFAWMSSSSKNQRIKICLLYGVNLFVNGLWSILYFGFHQPVWAFIDITLVLFTIMGAMIISWKIDKRASWLLLPYLLWVLFAMVLNYLSI